MSPPPKESKAWLGVDLGGTKILTAVFNDKLERLSRAKTAARAEEGAEAVVDRIAACSTDAVKRAGLEWSHINGVGVGAPSPIEEATGKVIFAPNLGWRDLPLREWLNQRLEPPVFVGNDCSLATLGIHTVEFEGKPRHLLGIFPGTGIGGGLIINRELVTGATGSAGEFGQMTLNYGGPVGADNIPGSLESMAGRASIAARIREAASRGQATLLTKIAGPELKEIKSGHLRKAIRRGDTFVESLVREAAERIGAAIGSLINIVNPEVIALGGGMVDQLEDLILPIIKTKVGEYTDPGVREGIKIVASRLADDAGVIGAAVLAQRSATTQ